MFINILKMTINQKLDQSSIFQKFNQKLDLRGSNGRNRSNIFSQNKKK